MYSHCGLLSQNATAQNGLAVRVYLVASHLYGSCIESYCQQLKCYHSTLPFFASGVVGGGGGVISGSGTIFGWLQDVLLMNVQGIVIL